VAAPATGRTTSTQTRSPAAGASTAAPVRGSGVTVEPLSVARTTAVGAATGIVVGLVAITPAAGFVSPLGALALGAVAAFPSYFAILHRPRTRLDDSLDVFAAHGTGGMVGALLTGVFAQAVWGGTDGLLFGNPSLLAKQALAVLAVAAYSGVATVAILRGLALVVPLRRTATEESLGLDLVEHGEEGYARGEGAVLVLPELVPVGAPAHGDLVSPLSSQGFTSVEEAL
jgi:Amt family ammonium transporter